MKNNRINYVEFKTNDLNKTKQFYQEALGWKFTDYGPNYASFSANESGLDGGFEHSNEPIKNGVLVVIYHEDLEKVQKKIVEAGGKISVPTFSFPGGERFQFLDPSGNELAVWRYV